MAQLPLEKIVSVMSPKEQERLLEEQRNRCWMKMFLSQNQTKESDQLTCEVTWDNLLCWDETPANTLARQPCPDYVNGLNKHEFASKFCTANGTWLYSTQHQHIWTNYTECMKPSVDLEFHSGVGERLRLIYTVGYSVSLASLIVAVFIMLCSRRLHSKSNTLHVNLFIAFILRASISFLKDLLFVQNLGLEKDIIYRDDGSLSFRRNGTHWECKLLFSMFNYTILASSVWILVEGLYLHNLIYRTLRTERNGVRCYVIIGWVLPVFFLIPWICVKATLENVFCWNLPNNTPYYWILKAPGIAIVIINFCFFLDIFRVLFLRARMTRRHIGHAKYRKLAKFILVLIPLFGVMYIVLYVAFPSGFNEQDFNPNYLYFEMTYNSFQGFVLALLFCFLNEEVHTELRRMYKRHKSRRGDSMALTRSFAIQSWKRGSGNRPAPNRSGGRTPPLVKQASNSSMDVRQEHSDELRRKVLTNSARFQIQPRPGAGFNGSKRGQSDDPSGRKFPGGREILLRIFKKPRRKYRTSQPQESAVIEDKENSCGKTEGVDADRGREGEKGDNARSAFVAVTDQPGAALASAVSTITKAKLEYHRDNRNREDDVHEPLCKNARRSSDDVMWSAWGNAHARRNENRVNTATGDCDDLSERMTNDADADGLDDCVFLEPNGKQRMAGGSRNHNKSDLTVRFASCEEGKREGMEKRGNHEPCLKLVERQAAINNEDVFAYADEASPDDSTRNPPLNGSALVLQSSSG